jgi:hypothetical protein
MQLAAVESMSKTILVPCRVPWAISPSTSGLTLRHSESDTQPECTVTLGAGRLRADGRTDDRRIEIVFELSYYARVGPHSDTEGVEALGYSIVFPFEYDPADYLERRAHMWREAGYCPDPRFYVAQQSAWLAALPDFRHGGFRHYVIDGRDGYVELIARRYRWREWLWNEGERELAQAKGPVVDEGEGDA